MKLIEERFREWFFERMDGDFFSPSDYVDALETYEAGFLQAREMAANACKELRENRPTTERGLLIAKECEALIQQLGEEEVK